MNLNILTIKKLLEPYIDYIEKLKYKYRLINQGEYVSIIFDKAIDSELQLILDDIEFKPLLWVPNGNLYDDIDCIVLKKLLGKNIKLILNDKIRSYYYEDSTPVYIIKNKIDYFLNAIRSVLNNYFVSSDPRMLLLNFDKIKQHNYGLPIWYTEDKTLIEIVNKQFQDFLSRWIWISLNSNLYKELCVYFNLENKLYGPFNNETYFFINVFSTIDKYVTIGELKDSAKDKFTKSIRMIQKGLLPVVTIKHGLNQENPNKIHYAAIKILENIYKQNNINHITINNQPKYLELFNYIKSYPDYIEIPIDSLDNAILFRMRLRNFDFNQLKVYNKDDYIEKHLKLKNPSLIINNTLIYTDEEEKSDYQIKLDQIINPTDPFSLEEFEIYKNIEDRFKIIVHNNYAYYSDNLINLNDKYSVLPYDRKPATIINYINLMLSGLVDHHHKIGMLPKHQNICFKENEEGNYIYKNSTIQLPKLEFKKFPYYDNMTLQELKNYNFDHNGYIVSNNDIISTNNFSCHISSSDHFNLIFITTKELADNLFNSFKQKYSKANFLSIWKICHPLSSFILYNFLPPNQEEKLDSHNDYIINWITTE